MAVALVISGMAVIVPMLVAVYRDAEGFRRYELAIFGAMFVNAWLFVLVERGNWPIIVLQTAIAATSIPVLRSKRRNRGERRFLAEA